MSDQPKHADETLMEQIDEAFAEEAEEAADAALGHVGQMEAELQEWKDKCLRLAADMENMRKRGAADMDGARKFALQGFAKDILPVADNLGRALEAPEGNEKALRDGVAMVRDMMAQVLAKHGIAPVEAAEGEVPNPELHQVMQVVQADGKESGTIVQVMQAGYTLNGRLVRPALVTVAA